MEIIFNKRIVTQFNFSYLKSSVFLLDNALLYLVAFPEITSRAFLLMLPLSSLSTKTFIYPMLFLCLNTYDNC